MANFVVTYDLNGPHPSHKEMDDHLSALGTEFLRGRLLETVWYVAGPANTLQLKEYILQILSPNDQLLVVEAANATWKNLLVKDVEFQNAFNINDRMSV